MRIKRAEIKEENKLYFEIELISLHIYVQIYIYIYEILNGMSCFLF